MTDFSFDFVAKWRAGEMPRPGDATHTVSYDQTTWAYKLPPDTDPASFRSWVAMTWQSDMKPQDVDEPDAEYLDRIDVDIREI